MVTDPVADMLSRIRNSLVARHDYTDMPASKIRVALAQVLKKEGYIGEYEVRSEGTHKNVRIHLAYTPEREPVIMGLQRVSRPGLRVYAGKREIPRVYGGLGIAILSTPEGVMTGQEARRRNVGGEVLCYVW
jgi:small subunit ribosomal protein S8